MNIILSLILIFTLVGCSYSINMFHSKGDLQEFLDDADETKIITRRTETAIV